MAKKKEIKIPKKETMNLYQSNSKEDPKRIAMIGALVVVVMSLVMAKFLIIDKVVELNAYEAENTDMQTQLIEMQTRTANYQSLKEEYYRYGEAYSSDEEKLVDRIVITSLLNDTTADLADITSTTIAGNLINISVVTSDLEKLAQFRTKLENNNMVKNVVVYSAARSTGDVVSSISFECIVEEGE